MPDPNETSNQRLRRLYKELGLAPPVEPTEPPSVAPVAVEPASAAVAVPENVRQAYVGLGLEPPTAIPQAEVPTADRAAARIARQGYAPPETGIPPFDPSVKPKFTLESFNREFAAPLAALDWWTRTTIDPSVATATSIRGPDLKRGKFDFDLNSEQLPWKSGWREAYNENVPWYERLPGEIILDPANLLPGVGFTKVPRIGRRAGRAAERATLARRLGEIQRAYTGPEFPPEASINLSPEEDIIAAGERFDWEGPAAEALNARDAQIRQLGAGRAPALVGRIIDMPFGEAHRLSPTSDLTVTRRSPPEDYLTEWETLDFEKITFPKQRWQGIARQLIQGDGTLFIKVDIFYKNPDGNLSLVSPSKLPFGLSNFRQLGRLLAERFPDAEYAEGLRGTVGHRENIARVPLAPFRRANAVPAKVAVEAATPAGVSSAAGRIPPQATTGVTSQPSAPAVVPPVIAAGGPGGVPPSIPPPAVPPSVVPPAGGVPPPVSPPALPTSFAPPPHRRLLPDPQPFAQHITEAFNPNNARQAGEWVAAHVPVMSPGLRWANPTFAATTDVGRAGVVRLQQLDDGQTFAKTLMSHARQLGSQEDLFGKTNPKTGLLESVPRAKGTISLVGRSVNEIAENPSSFSLSSEQRAWVDQMSGLEDELFDFLNRNGIKVAELPLDAIERYAGRIHVARIDKNGEIIATRTVRRPSAGGRPATTSMERQREFETIAAAQAEGYVPLSYEQSLAARARSAWRRVVDKNTTDWLKAHPPAGVTITPRAPGQGPGTFEETLNIPGFEGFAIAGPKREEVVSELSELFRNRTTNSFLKGVNEFNAVPRMFVLANDASIFFIQFLAAIYRHPLASFKTSGAFANTFATSIFTPMAAAKSRAAFIAENADLLQRAPGLLMSHSGVEATEAMERSGIVTVLGFPARPFVNAYHTAMDRAGVYLFQGLEHLAGGDPQKLRAIIDYVNDMRGLYSSARLGLTPNQRLGESALLLAGRYRRAVGALHASALQGGLRGDLARKAYASLAAGTMLTYAGITLALGKAQGKSNDAIKKDLVQGLSPVVDGRANPHFMLWNVGERSFGIGSKFVSDLRWLTKAMTKPESLIQLEDFEYNPFVRWMRAQMAPAPSAAFDIISGNNYVGDRIANDFVGEPLETLKSMSRMLQANITPLWLDAVIFDGVAPEEKAIAGGAEFVGMRQMPYPVSQYDMIAKKTYGKTFDSLNDERKGAVQRALGKRRQEVAYRMFGVERLSDLKVSQRNKVDAAVEQTFRRGNVPYGGGTPYRFYPADK